MLTGRRGGKTYVVKEKIVKKAATAPYRGEVWYIGPTHQQARELIWEPLEEALYQHGIEYRPVPSRQIFELSKKRKIYVIGAEKIRRIRGHKIWHAAMDEVAFFGTDLFEVWKAVRPTLTDLGGSCDMSTTPNGKGTNAYEFFMQKTDDKDWATHTWDTIDNPWIDPNEVELAKRELDEKSFAQEYLASWVSVGDLAYYSFSESVHVKRQPPIHTRTPLVVAFDFNVNPTTLLCRQKEGATLSYKKEYSLAHSSTEQTLEQFCDDHKHLKDQLSILVRGDASGKSRSSTTGKSNYYYVEQILTKHGFTFTMEVPSKNPPIVDRVKYLNGWLKPVEGPHRLEFDPSMKETIRDLSSQELNGFHPSDKNNLGHKADAVGYDVYQEHRLANWGESRMLRM